MPPGQKLARTLSPWPLLRLPQDAALLVATALLIAVLACQTVEELHSRAEQGNAAAQYNLGVMYDNGEGVPQDYAEAAKSYRLAAEQGEAW